MTVTTLFTPIGTVSLAVTNATARVALTSWTVQPGDDQLSLRVVSSVGGSECFIKTGTDNTVVAATTDMKILPGAIEVFQLPAGTTYVAAITASGTATLSLTIGYGG